jgi:Putative zinc-finger
MTSSADMTCEELVELVTAYLEGALPLPERERFEAHHRGCPGCQAHVAQVRLVVGALGRLQPSASEDLSAQQAKILELFRTRGLHRREQRERDIPLGLGSERAALGDHIAYFWEYEREFDAIAGFLVAGASLGEACVLIGHDTANERLLASLERGGLNVGALVQERQLQVASVSSSADELLLELGGRIMRLEAQVTTAAERFPSIVVCTYDVTTLLGPLLVKGGLECHPLTFRRECLRHNEHHVPPARFLEELSAGSE